MRSQTTNLSIEDIRSRLEPLHHDSGLQLIVLFGSLAKGLRNRKSDIDLAFLYDMPFDIVQVTNHVSQLLRSDAIDIVDLRTASPLLRFSAMQNGKVLYECSQGIFSSTYSLAFRRYVDTKKLRDAQQLAIRNYLDGQVRS
jgi:uncharacterized protein